MKKRSGTIKACQKEVKTPERSKVQNGVRGSVKEKIGKAQEKVREVERQRSKSEGEWIKGKEEAVMVGKHVNSYACK